MPADLLQLYNQIVAAAGGVENITALGNCMTRLRFTVKDNALVQTDQLRKIPDVAGYFFTAGQHQLIVGPSLAGKLAAFFREQHPFAPLAVGRFGIAIKTEIGNTQVNRVVVRKTFSGRISRACMRIGNIFLPLIPAYIGGGLILGLTNLLAQTPWTEGLPIVSFLSAVGGGIFFYLAAAVGWNTGKEFGGTPALCLALAGTLNLPTLAQIQLGHFSFVPGKGGIIAVLAVCWTACYVEKFLRKHIKNKLEMFLTPFLTLLVVGSLSLLIVQPCAGYLSDAITRFVLFSLKAGGAVTGAVLGGLFLPVVMLGLHQSLIPIHQQLVDALGYNPLFPILCMAGAGQVGASVAVLLKTKNERLKTIIKNALPVGLLGIGEPLIYGVTLPLYKPFLAACIGGAVGGAVTAALHVTSAIAFGVSGLVLLLALSNFVSMVCYALGYLAAVVGGFAAAWYIGFTDVEE